MDAAPILTLEAIRKQFPHQAIPAVDSIRLSLRQGDLLGLLGPSGCGKTTLLRLIAGFEKPQTGTITLGQRQVCGPGVWVPPERRDIGIVFQDYALFPHLSVLANVSFGLRAQARMGKLAASTIKAEAERAIALVGLQGFENRYPHELSGGQQQRVALARALAPRPTLVLLDEPFSNLDVQVRLYLRQEVRDILRSVGASGVFVTHDQEEALSISDSLAVMRQGQIEQIDPPEQVYHQPTSRFVAEFVTQANFLPTQRVGNRWETPLGSVPADAQSPTQGQGHLMVRQESIQLSADVQGSLTVRDRQFLGREYRYTLVTTTGHLLYARTGIHQRFNPGDTVRGTFAVDNPRIFPSEPVSAASVAPLSGV
jgi:iron(III) transport system ATP-binding protein